MSILRKTKRFITVLLISMLISLLSISAFAAGGGDIKTVNINLKDKAALQRGATIFVNNCLGCHSAAYMRYNRIAEDLGLSEDQVRDNFIFSDAKIGEVMNTVMSKEEATEWFGAPAPDLSVVGRSRGSNWLYAYFTSFYQDELGDWNNTVFPDVSMPHVLWNLQGVQTAVFTEVEDPNGSKHKVFDSFELSTPGSQTAAEYDRTVRDLVAYLSYMGEPAKLKRESIGVWVLLFLAIFTFVAYLLKVEYWRDIH